MNRDYSPLAQSAYKITRGKRYKSCPCCSQRAGRRVYKPLDEFGYRMDGDQLRIQTWCKDCRTASSKLTRSRKGA